MSNVIRFLEALGADAGMARMSILEYQAAVAALDLTPESSLALVERDPKRLEADLGARPQMLCVVFAPDNSPNEDEALPSEGDGETPEPTQPADS
jgi:hypothetical protein